MSLRDILTARLEAEGPMSVHDYMSLALTHPDHGYYVQGDVLGRQGDFVTAPEVSQMFGELIGLWAVQVWLDMGSPRPFHLVELGPGHGTLMSDALRSASQVMPDFVSSAEVTLVEISPSLRKVQAERIGHPVQWAETLDEVAPGPMILLANEFLDALPVHQYVRSHDGWHERLVAEGIGGAGTLGFCLSDDIARDLVTPDLDNLPLESIFETRPEAEALARSLAKRLQADKGAALFIDYGHERSAAGDTFQAVRDHKPIHVLSAPGQSDLTAHVDFESFASAAEGLAITPVVTQGDFLKRLGLEARCQALSKDAGEETASLLRSQFERLTAPDQMGTLFKVMALLSPGLPQPPGFQDAGEAP